MIICVQEDPFYIAIYLMKWVKTFWTFWTLSTMKVEQGHRHDMQHLQVEIIQLNLFSNDLYLHHCSD